MMVMKLESSILRWVILVTRVKDISLIGIFAAILFVQEQILSFIPFLPNVQLTILLLVLYTKVFGFQKTIIMVILHVFLDNLIMGSFNYLIIIFMILGWGFIPLSLSTIFKKVEKPISLACLGVLFALVFSWFMIVPGMIVQELSFKEYIIADIIFEVILAASSFITILWLYEPLYKVLNNLNNDYN